MKPTIAVLMATYNSEQYMRCQIDSILSQRDVEVKLLVRDDGSKDATHDILNEYAAQGKLTWYTGPNLKSARCFMQLLQDAPEADFYAFSDHDDFWQEDKLITAVSMLEPYNLTTSQPHNLTTSQPHTPKLYLSQPQAADEHLNPLPSKQFHPQGGFAESMIYWFAMGCTMVLNNPLRQLVNSYTPDFLYMHDVWIYSIAYAVGAKVVWDDTPHTLNRQTGSNVVGLDAGFIPMLRLRINRFLNGGEVRYRQAVELQRGYSSLMQPENQKLLQRFIAAKQSLRTRLSLIPDARFRCSDAATLRLFWANLLFNKY